MNVFVESLVVLVLSFNPIWEVRAGLLVGLLVFDMNLGLVMGLAFLGNVLVIPVARSLYKRFDQYASTRPKLGARLERVYARTRGQHSKRVELLEEFALFLAIGIPIPGTGAWTGMLLEHLFGLKPRQTLVPILLGIVASIVISAGVIVGFEELINLF